MANYGNEWLVVKYGTLFDRDSLLFICPINPNERKDLRWISKDQVISERWEINPLWRIFLFLDLILLEDMAKAQLFMLKLTLVLYNGQGVGLQGNSYAIPTKDMYIMTLPLNEIQRYVDIFLGFAEWNTDSLNFILTPIGCGLAGYKYEDIAPMFKNISRNVILPHEFKEILDAQWYV